MQVSAKIYFSSISFISWKLLKTNGIHGVHANRHSDLVHGLLLLSEYIHCVTNEKTKTTKPNTIMNKQENWVLFVSLQDPIWSRTSEGV